jgi:hypothetical protein
VPEEYCWAITQTAGRSCCGWSRSIVLEFWFQLDSLVYAIYIYIYIYPKQRSRYSHSLRAGRSGDRIPTGARFSAPILTSSGAHLAFYLEGTKSFLRVKWPGCGVHYPSTFSVKVKERVGLHLYSPLWAFTVCSRVSFTLLTHSFTHTVNHIYTSAQFTLAPAEGLYKPTCDTGWNCRTKVNCKW